MINLNKQGFVRIFQSKKELKNIFSKNGLQSNKGFVYLPSVLEHAQTIEKYNSDLKIQDNE